MIYSGFKFIEFGCSNTAILKKLVGIRVFIIIITRVFSKYTTYIIKWTFDTSLE